MLTVSEDLLALLATPELSDPHCRLSGKSALEFHLGLPVLAPYAISVGVHNKGARAPGAWVEIRREPPLGKPSRVDGVLIASICETLVGCMSERASPVDAESVALLAQRITREPRLRRNVLETLSEVRDAPALRRVSYLLDRVGLPAPDPKAGKAREPVLLRANGPKGGILHAATGVLVNAPDGAADDGSLGTELAKMLRTNLSRDARTLFDASALGLELDPLLCTALLGSKKAGPALSELTAFGILHARDDWFTPVAPLTVSNLSAAVPKPVRVAMAERASALLEARKEPRARRNLLRMLVLLEHPDAPVRVAREASAALDLGSTSEVRTWLNALRERAAPPDHAALVRLEMKLLEREGKVVQALRLAQKQLESLDREAHQARRDWILESARLSWQHGQAQKAQSLLARVRPLLRGHRDRQAQCQALLLRATIALEQGQITRSRALLKSARTMAELADDAEALAQVLRRVGTMEARAGRPHEALAAYQAALSSLADAPAPSDASLEAALQSNLATALSWLGQLDDAEAGYRRALVLRQGMALGALNTRAALALLDVARGRDVPPEGRFGPLAMQAEALGDPRLRVELNLYFAEERLSDDDPTRATRALAQARTALAELGGAERILEHMLTCTDACARAMRGDSYAIARFDSAVRGLTQIGASYHAARCGRMAATAAAHLGDDAQAERFLAESARCALAGDFVLGADADHVVVYVLGSLSSASWLSAYANACLDRVGRARILSLLHRAGRDDLATRFTAFGPGPRPVGTRYRCDGPEGSRWLTPAQRLRVREVAEGCVVLDVTEGEIRLSHGRTHDIRKRRVLAPLLTYLASTAPRASRVDELAREVWKLRPSASLASAVKMTVARLRKLLAEHGDWVETDASVRGELAYRIASHARLYVISEVEVGRSSPPPQT